MKCYCFEDVFFLVLLKVVGYFGVLIGIVVKKWVKFNDKIVELVECLGYNWIVIFVDEV